ncbi:hypothetical protein Tco_0206909 [Tanacetum coccineum]
MTSALSIENGSSIEGGVLFKFNVWVPIGKCNRVLERQKKLRNQIFRALTASADVPSSVTETTDTTSTLPPPPPPLQKPTGHRDIWEKVKDQKSRMHHYYKDGKVRSKCENKGIVPTEMELVLEYTQQGASHEVSEHLKMEMEIPCAQDGNRLLDDERLCLDDDLKKAHDQNQNKSIFKRENLSGSNFNDWFRSPKMVLRVEKKLFVIEQPISSAPPADSEYLRSGMRFMMLIIRLLVLCFVGLMLNGLTSDFARFVRNYNMHNMGKTIGELHALLIEYEKGLPKKAVTPQVMAIQGGRIQKANKKSLNAKRKGKGKGKGKDKSYIPKPKNPKPSTKRAPGKG